MRRLTEEELSRVLSGHANAILHYVSQFQRPLPPGGCLMQTAAADIEETFSAVHGHPDSDIAYWFDRCSQRESGTDEFLAAMEKAGIA